MGALSTFLRLTGAAVAIAVVCAAAPAGAQSQDEVSARALFEEGRAHLKAGRLDKACPSLEAASKLVSSPGILLNLADCFERSGKTASAWARFGEAADVAGRAHRADEAKEASARKAALEGKLTRLVIRVAQPIDGLTVARDGASVAPALWGSALPVDPGAHAVRAEAPAYEPWATSVQAEGAGATVTVDVPALRPRIAPTTSASATPPPSPSRIPTQAPPERPAPTKAAPQTLAWTLVIAGGAVAVGGGVLSLVEVSKGNSAADKADRASYDAAKTPLAIGDVLAVAGSAALVTGIVLLFTHRDTTSSTGLHATPWVGNASAGGALGGSW